MVDADKIIFTGGSGLLGSEFKKQFPDADYPESSDFNLLNYRQMSEYLERKNFSIMIHAAACTSPPVVEKNPVIAMETNIAGTVNVVKLCAVEDMKLIYISTDYVFRGDRGNYSEDDPVSPVNRYAWSKLGGECAVRMYDNSLIIRTSFGPEVFPYDKAFIDQWTSRETVSVITKKIIKLLDKDLTGVIHVGGKRKTVYEYAWGTVSDHKIGKISIHDVNFKVPAETSLNLDRYYSVTGEKISVE